LLGRDDDDDDDKSKPSQNKTKGYETCHLDCTVRGSVALAHGELRQACGLHNFWAG